MQNVSVVLKLIKTPQTGKTGIPHVVPDPRSGQIHLNEGTDNYRKNVHVASQDHMYLLQDTTKVRMS
jgi:hypothetical protein